MGLESVTYISDLVPNWPLATDKRREGDDHLRAIKVALKNTFPNLNGPVTATPAQLNGLPQNSVALVAELIKHLVPMRTVVAFSGTAGQVPVGWALCNGQTVAGFGAVPDLRGKFILGESATYQLGAVGGLASANSSSAGAHTHTIQGVAINASQMPAHSHRLLGSSASGDDIDPVDGPGAAVAGTSDGANAYVANNNEAQLLVENTGSGQPHTHGMDSGGAHTHTVATLPPYYVLAFIIKVSEYTAPV